MCLFQIVFAFQSINNIPSTQNNTESLYLQLVLLSIYVCACFPTIRVKTVVKAQYRSSKPLTSVQLTGL